MYAARNVGAAQIDGVRYIFSLLGENSDFVSASRNAIHRAAGPQIALQLFDQPRSYPAIALRPCQRTFFFRLARGKILHAGPRRGVFRQRAVVIAASVIDVPAQRRRIEALLREPIGHEMFDRAAMA